MELKRIIRDIESNQDILELMLAEATHQFHKDAKLANCSLTLAIVPNSIAAFMEDIATSISQSDRNANNLSQLNYCLDISEKQIRNVQSTKEYAELIAPRILQKVWFRLNWSNRV